MNKRQLAERLAKQAHTSRAKAADDVDSLVYGLLKDMKDSAKKVVAPEASAAPKPPTTAKPASNDPAISRIPAKEKK